MKASLASRDMAEEYFARPSGMEGVTSNDWMDDGFILAHYKAGDTLELHVDGQSSEEGNNGLRVATALFFLNQAEGGELEFPLQNQIFKPTLGMGIMFPVDYNFPHRVMKAKTDRYILQTWLTDPRYQVVRA